MWKTANLLMVLVTAGVFVWQVLYWFPILPDIVPSHFDTQGNVDDEMGKTQFFVVMGLVNAIFLSGFPLLAKTMSKIPNSMLNVPNKEYWLAPERRESTLAQTGNLLTTIGWITSWLIIGIVQLTCLVAIGARETIYPEVYVLLAIFLTAVFGLVGWMFWSYRIPSDAAPLPQES